MHLINKSYRIKEKLSQVNHNSKNSPLSSFYKLSRESTSTMAHTNTRAISTLCFYIPHNSVINWPKNCNVLSCKILKKREGQSKAKEQLKAATE